MNPILLVLSALWTAFWLALGASALPAAPAAAAPDAGFSALAGIVPARSSIRSAGTETEVTVGLSQPVPYRAFLLADPPRLVVDFRELDFSAMPAERMLGTPGKGALISGLRWGRFRPGWSRMVAELSGPARIATAEEMTAGDRPEVAIHLLPTSAADFAAHAGAPDSALWALPGAAPVGPPLRRQDGSRPLKVVIDPGHGGIDPGAEAAGLEEKDITLSVARQLKEAMTRAGMQVTLTRNEDVFVPLETRITVAHDARADLFISLHADALAEGEATGATIYMFDLQNENQAARQLAERHNRDDLLAGVDLSGHDDRVASVLMDLARTETQPRAVRLAQVLVGALRTERIKMYRHPVQRADFSVLKSPDIPSVLIEMGFLSSPENRQRLMDKGWRERFVAALTSGVETWSRADAAEAKLLRH